MQLGVAPLSLTSVPAFISLAAGQKWNVFGYNDNGVMVLPESARRFLLEDSFASGAVAPAGDAAAYHSGERVSL
jgi:hypothetical protein